MNTGEITFENGVVAQHDLIVGADGIGSAVRGILGIRPEKKPADQSCLHANVSTEEAVKAGLVDYSQDSALEYWGGQEGKWDKIVLSPCNGGKLLSYYCFFPREQGDYTNQTWGAESRSVGELLKPYPELDRQVFSHLAIGKEIQPWRLWVHDPYPYIQRGNVCLLGDAGHPMMPHQSQGACMAIEDAASLGILFSKRYFCGDIRQALTVYEEVRLPRATRVQAAAARAAYNINERIGECPVWTDLKSRDADTPRRLLLQQRHSHLPRRGPDEYSDDRRDERVSTALSFIPSSLRSIPVADLSRRYDMYKDIEEKLAAKQGQIYADKFLCGLPIGLELPNGIIIGAA